MFKFKRGEIKFMLVENSQLKLPVSIYGEQICTCNVACSCTGKKIIQQKKCITIKISKRKFVIYAIKYIYNRN